MRRTGAAEEDRRARLQGHGRDVAKRKEQKERSVLAFNRTTQARQTSVHMSPSLNPVTGRRSARWQQRRWRFNKHQTTPSTKTLNGFWLHPSGTTQAGLSAGTCTHAALVCLILRIQPILVQPSTPAFLKTDISFSVTLSRKFKVSCGSVVQNMSHSTKTLIFDAPNPQNQPYMKRSLGSGGVMMEFLLS